jgi:acyl-CoA reductase-like NAD-dependent aldehyde dehydrogenase
LFVTLLTVRSFIAGDTETGGFGGLAEREGRMSDSSGLSEERVAYLDRLVNQARTAAAAFSQYTQEDVDRIVKPMVIAGLEAAQDLARLAIEETKIGVLEDKPSKTWWPPSLSTTT